MTIVKTEPQHKGEFLLSEAPGALSREKGVLTAGQKVADGRALALSAGKLVAATGAMDSSGDSSEVIVGFAYGAVDASADGPGGSVDTPIVYIARLAEVKSSNVTLHAVTDSTADEATAAVKAELAKLFLVLR